MALSIQQFGARIKQKYPQYSDLDDEDLGRRVLKKYPVYQDMVSTEETSSGFSSIARPFMRGFEENLVPFSEGAGKAVVPGDYEERAGEQGFGSKVAHIGGSIVGMIPTSVATGGTLTALSKADKAAKILNALNKGGKVARATAKLWKPVTEASVLGFTREADDMKERLSRTGEYAATAGVTELVALPLIKKLLNLRKKAPATTAAVDIAGTEAKIKPPGFFGAQYLKDKGDDVVDEQAIAGLLPSGKKPINLPAPQTKNFTPLKTDPGVLPDIAEKTKMIDEFTSVNKEIESILKKYDLLKKADPTLMSQADLKKIIQENNQNIKTLTKEIKGLKGTPLDKPAPKYPNMAGAEERPTGMVGKTLASPDDILPDSPTGLNEDQILAINYLRRQRGLGPIDQQDVKNAVMETSTIGSPVANFMGETTEKVAGGRMTKPKIKVGGGTYSTDLFAEKGGEGVEAAIRQRSKQIGEAVKAERGDFSRNIDKDTLKISDILAKDTKQGVNYEYNLATSEYITAAQKKVLDLKTEMARLQGRGLPTADIEAKIAAEGEVVNKLLTKWYGAGTSPARAMAVRRAINETIETPVTHLKRQLLKDVDRWGGEENVQKLLNGIDKFDPKDKMGIMNFLKPEFRTNVPEALETYWRNAILSGTGTHIANSIGNLIRTTLHVGGKPLRVAGDVIRSGVKGTPREEYMGEWLPEIIGLTKGYKDGFKKALSAFKTGFRSADVENLNAPTQVFSGKYSQWLQTSDRMLMALDEFSRSANEGMELYRQAAKMGMKEGLKGQELYKRIGELVTNPTSEMLGKSKDLASKLLYQEMTEDLTSFSRLRNLFSFSVPGGGRFRPMYYIIPFVQTPINVAKFVAEWSPFGFATLAQKGLSNEEINRRFASAVLGTSVLSWMGLHYLENPDDIVGAAPQKGSKEEQAFYSKGKIPYSIKVNIGGKDRWVQYSRIDPIGPWLAMMATGLKLREAGVIDDEGLANGMMIFALQSGGAVLDRTFLTGINDFMEAAQNKNMAKTWLGNMASGFLPASGFTGSVARSMDRTVRQPETVDQVFMTKIPEVSKNVPPKPSQFEKEGVSKRNYPWWQEFLPIKVTDEADNVFIDNYFKYLENKRAVDRRRSKAKKAAEKAGFKSSGQMK